MSIQLDSEMHVELIDSMGSDLRIVNAARMSLDVEHPEFLPADEGLIRSLIRNGHGTPFEKPRFEFMVHVPIFIAREWFKHRFSSFNEVSGRYSEYKPIFYMPPDPYIRKQIGKAMSYDYKPIEDANKIADYKFHMHTTYTIQWNSYQAILAANIAKEIARIAMPIGLYTKFMWGTDLRNLTNFLVLRNAPQAQQEIQDAAKLVEKAFEQVCPITYRIWNEEGRPRLAALDG